MGYPKEILAAARRKLETRRESSMAADAALRARVLEKSPEAFQIAREVSTTSLRLARALLAGGDVAGQIEEIRHFNLCAQQRLGDVLTMAGFAPDALEPHPSCLLCGDTGMCAGMTCDCLRRIQKQLMYERLGASAPIGICTFDQFDLRYYANTLLPSGTSPAQVMAKTLETCQTYARDFSLVAPSLLLRGGPGLGKTHLSLAIGRTVIENGFDALYAPFHSLLGRLESARFGRNGNDYQEYLAPAQTCDLLILDDLGSEFLGPFAVSLLYDLINSRQLTSHPTVISTNLLPSELTARYGERVSSRLFGGYQTVPFVGEDVRMQKTLRAPR
ncbi:MAG: ATP-binding protein [Oscillospiraceae bacterium]